MTDSSSDLIGATSDRADGAGHSVEEADILRAARQVADSVLGPNAQESDRAAGPNPANFRALADAGLLGIAIPRAYGGLGASGATQRAVTEILAAACGVTTFVQAQHHGAAYHLAGAPNAALKQRLLPDMAAGRMLCAVSIAHWRRPDPPVLRAEPVEGGYRLSGTAPWVTGWGLMNQVVVAATLPDGRIVFVWSPARREEFADLFAGIAPPDGDWGSLRASDPLPLCAMNASATVTLTLDGWFVPQAHWLHESDRETLQRNDRSGVLGPTALTLGCTAASVRLLCETAERRPISAIRRAAAAFAAEWEATRKQVLEWIGKTDAPDFFENAVRLRAGCIELAVRAAHAAVAASSGAANTLAHPAQRLLREAMFYTIQAQTVDVMDATLARLERPSSDGDR
ncbi:MAG TPA: acyl-CoA dehydrogenase family protein [Chthonomonadaceae bacterium]|nr:acyl-CoA dehydrogenase family protein [Chthonomonadaceae bacterium]